MVKALLSGWSLNLVQEQNYVPFLICILKMLECSDGEIVGTTNQTIEVKATEHYSDHIFCSVLKGIRTFFCCFRNVFEYIINEKLRAVLKNRLSKLHKLSQKIFGIKVQENTITASLIHPIENVSSINDSNLRIPSLLYRFSFNISLFQR